MKLSRREIALLLILILVSSGYIFDLVVFKPLQAQISSLKAENMTLNQQTEVLRQQQSQYADTERQQRILVEYGMMRAKIPPEPLIPGIMEFLELKAQETMVVIQSVKCKDNLPADSSHHQQNSTDPNLQTISFQIRVQGSYFNLLSFLLQIETASRIFMINSCALTSRPESDETVAVHNAEETEEKLGTHLAESPAWLESAITDQYSTVLDLDFSAYYMESEE